jgi:hypothetical protein
VRWIALVLLVAAAAAFAPGAAAKSPCRNQIYKDWDGDGKIASTYPLSCYRSALEHVTSAEGLYTSLQDDIRAALQAAAARDHGRHVAGQVGHGFVAVSDARGSVTDKRMRPIAPAAPKPSAVAAADPPADDDGIPTPFLVLGGVALALAACGGIGLAVRR